MPLSLEYNHTYDDLPNYAIVRSHIQSLDLISWRGEYIESQAIRFFSTDSHTSVVLRIPHYQRIVIVEALATGLEIRALSDRLRDYHGKVYWLSLDLTARERERGAIFAWDELLKGVPYDYPSIIKWAFDRPVLDPERWFCSEFAQAVHIESGRLTPREDGLAISPGEIEPEYERQGINVNRVLIHDSGDIV